MFWAHRITPSETWQAQFAELGVQTAVDDFGVGYSSLGYLKKTDFSSIKIDRSFVNDIGVNTSALKLCNAIMSMASSLGLSVTAEGVESKEHLAILKAMKIHKYQGFYMSRPIDSDAFELLLQAQWNNCSARIIDHFLAICRYSNG